MSARAPRRRVSRAAAALLLAVAAAACADAAAPGMAASLEFNGLPSPSIVIGDVLRDLEGRETSLRDSVQVFDARGRTLPDAPVVFRVLEDLGRPARPTGLAIDSATGTLRAEASAMQDTVGIQAEVLPLRPPAIRLAIVAAPTGLRRAVDTIPTFTFSRRSPEATPITRGYDELRVIVERDSTGTAMRLRVPAYPVRFTVIDPGAEVLDSVRFVNDASVQEGQVRAAAYDTTDANGTAARPLRLYFRPGAVFTPGASDTVVVRAMIRVRGTPLDSVDLRLRVQVQPAAATP